MIAGALSGLVIVLLSGRSLRPLIRLRLRWSWLIFAALGLQLLITTFDSGMGHAPATVIHFASYACVFGFLVANRRLPGLPVVIGGALLNLAAITANGGVMPALPSALDRAGIAESHAFHNSAPQRDAHLQFLGDDFAVPRSWPLPNVFSVGDVLIDIGAIWLIVATCRHDDDGPGDDAEPEAVSEPELSPARRAR